MFWKLHRCLWLNPRKPVAEFISEHRLVDEIATTENNIKRFREFQLFDYAGCGTNEFISSLVNNAVCDRIPCFGSIKHYFCQLCNCVSICGMHPANQFARFVEFKSIEDSICQFGLITSTISGTSNSSESFYSDIVTAPFVSQQIPPSTRACVSAIGIDAVDNRTGSRDDNYTFLFLRATYESDMCIVGQDPIFANADLITNSSNHFSVCGTSQTCHAQTEPNRTCSWNVCFFIQLTDEVFQNCLRFRLANDVIICWSRLHLCKVLPHSCRQDPNRFCPAAINSNDVHNTLV